MSSSPTSKNKKSSPSARKRNRAEGSTKEENSDFAPLPRNVGEITEDVKRVAQQANDFFHNRVLPVYRVAVETYETVHNTVETQYRLASEGFDRHVLRHPAYKAVDEKFLQPHLLPKVRSANEKFAELEAKLALTAEDFFDSEDVRLLPARIGTYLKPVCGPAFARYLGYLELDSPVTLLFALACFLVHVIATDNIFTNLLFLRSFFFPKLLGNVQQDYFSVHPWAYWQPVTEVVTPLRNWWYLGSAYSYLPIPGIPMSILRLFTHVVGHGDWGHLSGNMVNLLLAGPAAEREFGSYNLLKVILYVAVFSAFAHIAFGNAASIQLGASGVVFMCILLSSLVQVRLNRIPVTFVLQVLLWVQKEIIDQFLPGSGSPGVSNIAHLSGAVVGTVMGFRLHGERLRQRVKEMGIHWLKKTREKSRDE